MRQPAMMTGTLHSVNGVSDKDHSYARQSKNPQDFQPLSAHIEIQKRLAYCGVASSVMVLNALGLILLATALRNTPDKWSNAVESGIMMTVNRENIGLRLAGKVKLADISFLLWLNDHTSQSDLKPRVF